MEACLDAIMIDYAYVIIHLFSTVFVVLVTCSVLASPFEGSYHLLFTVFVSISLTFSELDPCVKTSPEGHEVLDMVGQNIWDYGQRFAHEPFSINTHFLLLQFWSLRRQFATFWAATGRVRVQD